MYIYAYMYICIKWFKQIIYELDSINESRCLSRARKRVLHPPSNAVYVYLDAVYVYLDALNVYLDAIYVY